MDKYKKWILLILGLIIILVIAIFTLSQYSSEEKEPRIEEIDNQIEGNTTIQVKQEIQTLNNRNLYFTLEKIVEDYEQYVTQNNQTAMSHVNVDNSNPLKATNIEIKQIYYKEGITYGSYYISSIDQENNGVHFAIYLDNVNSTYLIEKLEEATFKKIIEGSITKIRNEAIVANEHNQYQYINVSDEDMIEMYLDNFIEVAKNDPNLAYEKLDNEYKQKKFGNVENFKRYIENNAQKIENRTITHYGTDKSGEYNKYYYRDTNHNYYTIKEKSIMDYTILLDEYTIKDTEYLKMYEQLSSEEKVNNNISIFIRMLNEKEYRTAYRLLDQTFRNNNFKTEEEFETYVTQNFWNNNIATISKIEKQGNLYLCTYKIKSGMGLSAEEMTKSFVMQLQEGTDFVMSFGI